MDFGQDAGNIALDYACEEYNLTPTDRTEGIIDAKSDNGANYQVKGCVRRYKHGERGRFRIFENDHQPQHISYYVFVVYDRKGRVVAHRRMRPETVTDMCKGRWTTNNHALKDSREVKLNWKKVMDW